jgi:FkbM family methyltransferase
LVHLKNLLTRHERLYKVYRNVGWQVHKLQDLKSFFWPKELRGFIEPFGFHLVGPDTPATRAMLRGKFETEELAAVIPALQWAETFVDVGANVGLYTCIARHLGRQTLSIEPQTGNLGYLLRNLTINGWEDAAVWPVGISSKPGLLTLFGASGPSASLIKAWAGYSARFKQTIPVTTLDTLVGDRFYGKRLFIKIDVEGAEYDVLLGSERTLALEPQPIWMVELCLSEYHPGGTNPNFKKTFDIFWKHGYQARAMGPAAKIIHPEDVDRWVAQGKTEDGEINFLFSGNESFGSR